MSNHAGSPVTVFAGKGGVGKTTCAAAAAQHSASLGRKTLVISTDATPSLAHIFDTSGYSGAKQVEKDLYFQEIGMDEARQMWDSRFGKDVYQVFSSFVDLDYAEFTDFMASMLPGLAEEFLVDYIRELCQKGEYEAVVWDTAPLGQTLALLETPSMVSKHLRMAPRIYTRFKAGAGARESILDIIKRWEALSAVDMEFLRRGVDFNIVAIAEALAVNQLGGILAELDKHAFRVSRLIINNLVSDDSSAFLHEKSVQQKAYLDLVRGKYPGLPITCLPMRPHEIKGIERIREIAAILFE
jgi:arsenite/tail-anchored protein-transporting ATPase